MDVPNEWINANLPKEEDVPQTKQDTNYAQNYSVAPSEYNPNHNPSKDINSLLHAQIVNRELLLKNIKNLSKLDKVRLSRSTYLLHANRYNIRNQ